jgi:hypothetical protein
MAGRDKASRYSGAHLPWLWAMKIIPTRYLLSITRHLRHLPPFLPGWISTISLARSSSWIGT